MSWTKLPALTVEQAGLRSGCLTCGPQPVLLSADAFIAVGFGSAGISRDGETLWQEGNDENDEKTCADAEAMAIADPDHDWRIFYYGPLSESVYQRHGAFEWVLVEKGQGFA